MDTFSKCKQTFWEIFLSNIHSFWSVHQSTHKQISKDKDKYSDTYMRTAKKIIEQCM
jgi:hypothetical protein